MRGERLEPGQYGVINTTKIKPGKWRADCYWRDTTGKLRRLERTGNTEAQATQRLKLARNSGKGTASVKTVADLLVEWLRRHEAISPTTRERYQDALNWYLIPAIGSIRIEELSTPIVDDAIRSIYIDHSRFAAQRSRTLLRMACKWGTRMQLVERDFTAEVPVPGRKGGKRERAWAPNDEQIDKLCILLEADYKSPTRSGPRTPSAWLAAELMRSTGARIGEVCAARWENIDWEVGTITFEDTIVFEEGENRLRGHLKNYDPRRVSYLPLPMLHLLRQHRQDTGPIVVARGGETMQTSNLRRAWRRVYDRAGVPAHERVRPHDLRRAVGTKLTAELGIDAASAQLGDTRDITERHYVMPNYRGPKGAREVLGSR